MNKAKKLSILGGVLIFFGLLIALYTNHYSSKATLLLINRVIVDDIGFNSPKTIEIEKNIKRANSWFYFGFFCTAIGIIFQISGTVIEGKK